MVNDRPGTGPATGDKTGSNGHERHLAAEELGALYAVAKEAVDCLDFGMSVKEAVQQARTAAPGGRHFTPQQVVQGAHDIISAGPDEELDTGPGTDGGHGPATR
ncbi:hypothetical protein [Streptomyces sp. NPDC001678]|uniref:hypothetical protein n=1 Tax=Streptomyces sp. NPDC001678 TaxID=3364599 RepID=UPI0036CA341B